MNFPREDNKYKQICYFYFYGICYIFPSKSTLGGYNNDNITYESQRFSVTVPELPLYLQSLGHQLLLMSQLLLALLLQVAVGEVVHALRVVGVHGERSAGLG